MKVISRLMALCALGLAVAAGPAYAAGTGPRAAQPAVNWQQRDTAVYVVSTMNLLNRTGGHTITQVLAHLGVAHLDVYADTAQANLYFIELKRADGSIAGVLAYQMGWPKPKRVVWSTGRTVPAVDPRIAQAYRTDPRTLIGTFTSTTPQ
jgi:hypothetical protein